MVVYVRHRSDRSGPDIGARVGTALAAVSAIGVIPGMCRVLVDALDHRRTIAELRAMVRAGDVEVVVVDRIESLSGDVIVLDALMREFAAAGVELVVPHLGRLARADMPAAGLLPSARRLRV
ncbi:hypothetical protein MOTC310_17720 [Methylobacterium oryzae]|uniref:Resolvase/invertase-type recombinase catalytic domain-containing protein n=1 Tax=Methylobacterium oryzae TaxID=334852 RepID=A0ABU7TSR7_9HYPH